MDMEEIWTNILDRLLANVDEEDPKRVFLDMMTPIGCFGDQLVLMTSSDQVCNWVRKNYSNEIKEAAYAVTGNEYTVNITMNPKSDPEPAPQAQQPKQSTYPQNQGSIVDNSVYTDNQPDWMNAYNEPPVQPSQIQPQQSIREREPEYTKPAKRENKGNAALFSKCTFDTFITGSSNEFARGAALAVAEQPGTIYNPLFIYGPSGLGKTHLLVAIANYINQNYPNMDTQYVSANEFLSDYVASLSNKSLDNFNNKYRRVDVLLIDDIQYLEGKEETINQLFNIFNEMMAQSKQIVLSADRAPRDINMDTRVTSRFMAGLLADVQPPDYETRLAIIKNCYKRATQTSTFFGVIDDDVMSYLAETATSNIREMEGAVTRLIGNMTLCRKPSITVDEAKEVLQDFFPESPGVTVTIDMIQAEVERFFEISHEDLIGSKRSRDVVYPRHIAIYLSRYMTEESLENIGRKFGGRDHTTIMHSVNKIEGDQQDNRALYEHIERLTARIKEQGI